MSLDDPERGPWETLDEPEDILEGAGPNSEQVIGELRSYNNDIPVGESNLDVDTVVGAMEETNGKVAFRYETGGPIKNDAYSLIAGPDNDVPVLRDGELNQPDQYGKHARWAIAGGLDQIPSPGNSSEDTDARVEVVHRSDVPGHEPDATEGYIEAI